jgi:hypothetical protein
MEILDAKAEGTGEVIKPNLPPDIAQLRMNLIHRVIAVGENVKVFYLKTVESFVKQLVETCKTTKGEIDIGKMWNDIMQANPLPPAKIDFKELCSNLPKVSTGVHLGLKSPQCGGVGEVIRPNDPRHPDNKFNK